MNNSVEMWIERGKEFIDPSKHELWENCVRTRAKGESFGKDLDVALGIMQLLDYDLPMESVMDYFNKKNLSDLSKAMVVDIVWHFSKRGCDFFRANTNMEEIISIGALEDVVEKLLDAKSKGKHVFTIFNGHVLISDTVTMDKAFLEVTGFTRADFDKKRQELLEEDHRKMEENKKVALSRVDEWIERGKAVIDPSRHHIWEEYVRNHAVGMYHGDDTEISLQIMEALERGESLKDSFNILKNADTSGYLASIIIRTVMELSSRGPDFYEVAAFFELSDEDKQYLEEKRQENRKLEELRQEAGSGPKF